ncbi:MAG: AAA-like domain-containing protein [Clostridiales bacterium]|nr:AAA-like domain-containing protein [Clostridiales bacterium]
MKRLFNVTGACNPQRHYMVDISGKLYEIEKMIETGQYFIINRPRQYGKTTAMYALERMLKDKYLMIQTSFEGIGDSAFESEDSFCRVFLELLGEGARFNSTELSDYLMQRSEDIGTFKELSGAITDFIVKSEKDVVLMIDEVDKSSNSQLFLSFLGMLRTKYLAAAQGKDYTFLSVILAGVHDIKNLKLKIRSNSEKKLNSPWNIAADFRVDMSFSVKEIESMLSDYTNETGISMDISLISQEIRKFTNGYPYLVSRLCKNIDEYLDRDWNLRGLEASIKMTLKEKSTLFDDVIKNLENNSELKALVYEILVEGRKINYNPDAYEKGIMYGILMEKQGKIEIHNKLFEERIYDYLLAQQEMRALAARFTDVDEKRLIEGGRLDMEKVLLKFQEFMYEQYRQEDERFYETNGRLIFLAYLRPILNGRGFSFVEAQTRENRRMDVVITFGAEKFVVELKIWNGRKYEEKGLEQLADYLEMQRLDAGYMVVFNFNSNKKYSTEWVEVKARKIFEVVV